MTAHKPLVSVIMNCFNGERYLREAVESVIQQTYQNWELIFWDNQSTDSSAEIFKSFSDSRLKYLFAPNHTSLYTARNLAIAESSGDFIAFLDVDDAWEYEKLEKQIPLFEDEDVGLVCSNYWIIQERSSIRSSKKRLAIKNGVSGFVSNQLLKNYFIGILTAVIRRKSYLSLDYQFDPRFNIIGDYDLFLRVSLHWKIEYQSEALASYRYHENNLSKTKAFSEVEEFEIWLKYTADAKLFQDDGYRKDMQGRLLYTKVLAEKCANNRIKAFKYWNEISMGYWKARGAAALIIPNWLFKTLRK